jgi:hypothetical protein
VAGDQWAKFQGKPQCKSLVHIIITSNAGQEPSPTLQRGDLPQDEIKDRESLPALGLRSSDEASDQQQSDVLSTSNPTSSLPTMQRRQLEEKLHDKILGSVALVNDPKTVGSMPDQRPCWLTAMVQQPTAALHHHIFEFKVIHGNVRMARVKEPFTILSLAAEELVMSFSHTTS